VVQERPVTTYVDSEEASFGSYWRIPARSFHVGLEFHANNLKILLAVIWNILQLFCLCIRGRQYPGSAWLAFIEMCIFILLISATTAFLGVNRPHNEKQAFGFSAIEGWMGMFSGCVSHSTDPHPVLMKQLLQSCPFPGCLSGRKI
jgi:hypothetical protein